MISLVKKIIREPLLHFLLVGAALFVLYSWVGNKHPDSPERIVVSRGQIDQLIVGFTRTWQRPPSEQELHGLINDHIREDVFYRQAKKMGLDEDDVIVRRRLRQKLEFLTEDLVTQTTAPTDKELQVYYNQHAKHYQEEPRFTFEQIFISRERQGKATEAVAKSLLAQLNANPQSQMNNNAMGDSSLLPLSFTLSTASEINRLFGEKFSEQMQQINLGRWAGPLVSSYGLHLVYIHEHRPSKSAEWSKLRDTVLRDMLNDRRQQALEKTYNKLISTYQVVVEPFTAASTSQQIRSVTK